jgi:hypothetical protein
MKNKHKIKKESQKNDVDYGKSWNNPHKRTACYCHHSGHNYFD